MLLLPCKLRIADLLIHYAVVLRDVVDVVDVVDVETDLPLNGQG